MADVQLREFTDQEREELNQAGLTLELIEEENSSSQVRLCLRDLDRSQNLVLSVDFLAPSFLHRLRTGIGKSQPLAKALGLKSLDPNKAPFVLDATAGLGIDAVLMAVHGCRVRSIERSPFVTALLLDGWRRLRQNADDNTATLFRGALSRLTFEHGNAIEILKAMSGNEQPEERPEDRPDVVYLDPMYPEEGRSKSALPKKGMQLFRRLIGEDLDAEELLVLALATANDRVIVKRPMRAPHLLKKPQHQFLGKTARFDMYLCRTR